MKLQRTNRSQILNCLILITIGVLVCATFTGAAAAQSTDLDHPTPMTANEVTGRWPNDKATSYFFGFEGGPGQIVVMFDFVLDHDIQNVAGELTDSYGRGIGNLDDSQKRSELSYHTTPEGLRLVGRYELKRRQKLVVRVSSVGDPGEVIAGRFKIRVEGGGVSFNAGTTPPSSANNASNTAGNDASCLPKSGRLRLLMDDGTVQEISLSRVRQATVKP